MTHTRKEVNHADTWNVESLYPSLKAWEEAFQKAAKDPTFPEITRHRGTLKEGPKKIRAALEAILSTKREGEKLFTYSHLRHDEETSNNDHKAAFNKIRLLLTQFNEACSWFEPELLSLSPKEIDTWLKAPELKEYAIYLEKILHLRAHTLSPEIEALLASAGQALSAPQRAYSALCDADFKFGTVTDSQGNEKPLTHASYGNYLRSHDRTLRKNSFEKMLQHYKSHENSLTELLVGQLQAHIFEVRARKYDSCLEAALFPKKIDPEVYRSLIKTVHAKIPLLHRYLKLRKQLLGVDELQFYDLYVPLVDEIDLKMSYEEASNELIASVAPLGRDYQETLKKGLTEQRWVDRYENKNKRSGAYSSGCYDSFPFILMNYQGILRDVFTLAHEAGHSMHSHLSRTHQSYQDADYPIFVAEVASTFNEELLMQHLLSKTKEPRLRAYLLNEKLEAIRTTLLRQTLFAEFELKIHEALEQGVPLTPGKLNELYGELTKTYFGEEVASNGDILAEWARIPHFYYFFYVYQYATGISAALSLAKKVLKGGEKERAAYLRFLQSGSSRYPLDLLKEAGVDLSSPEPVETALDQFGTLLEEFEELMAPQAR